MEIDKTDVAEVRKFLKIYCEHNRLKHRVESSSMTADGKSVGTRTRFTWPKTPSASAKTRAPSP